MMILAATLAAAELASTVELLRGLHEVAAHTYLRRVQLLTPPLGLEMLMA